VLLGIVDLVRDAGEAQALREHLAWSPYPEYAEHVEDVQRAIVLCCCGLWDLRVTVNGEEHKAAPLVAVLDLESFVYRRMSAWAN
jgi:N-acyl-D-aspartate/D-glutamate deacylase